VAGEDKVPTAAGPSHRLAGPQLLRSGELVHAAVGGANRRIIWRSDRTRPALPLLLAVEVSPERHPVVQFLRFSGLTLPEGDPPEAEPMQA
jgi:hypothetical protein